MFFFFARSGLAVCKTLGSSNTDFGENELFFTPKDECEDESSGFDRALETAATVLQKHHLALCLA